MAKPPFFRVKTLVVQAPIPDLPRPEPIDGLFQLCHTLGTWWFFFTTWSWFMGIS